MNRLNQTEPATFYNFAVFFRDSVFLYFIEINRKTTAASSKMGFGRR
jgi:hypothetical protein